MPVLFSRPVSLKQEKHHRLGPGGTKDVLLLTKRFLRTPEVCRGLGTGSWAVSQGWWL